MKNRLKYPLSLFVIWHPDFAEGGNIANDLYSVFCRDINHYPEDLEYKFIIEIKH